LDWRIRLVIVSSPLIAAFRSKEGLNRSYIFV
jgi:hypothetical protein